MKNKEIKFEEWNDRVIKVLNDAFATIIEYKYKEKGENIKLEYVFQSYGLYLHEYLGSQESENVYYLITSDMEKNCINYKIDKNYFEEIKKQLQNNFNKNPKYGTIEIDLRNLEKDEWIFYANIDIFDAYVSMQNKNLDNKIYKMKIGPTYDLVIIKY